MLLRDVTDVGVGEREEAAGHPTSSEVVEISELNRILLTAARLSTTQRTEDLRRLSGALKSLRKYTEVLLHEGSSLRPNAPDASKMELHWDSWQQSSAIATAAGPFPTTPSSSSARDASQREQNSKGLAVKDSNFAP